MTTMCCGNHSNTNASEEGSSSITIPLEVNLGIVDQMDMDLFGIVGMLGFCSFFVVFGVVSNAINMGFFVKIGLKDTINVSLFALAISDLMSCLTMAPCVLTFNPFIEQIDLPVNWFHVGHVIGAWPHVAFTKITTLITAVITVERCLCVFIPLKVKAVMTRRRVIGYLVSSYLFVGALLAPELYANQLGWTLWTDQNRSIFGLIYVKEREDIEIVVIPIINAVISVFGFVLIITSTIVLVVSLNKKAQWRLEATSSSKSKSESNASAVDSNSKGAATKEQRISKMVVMISTLFIVSLLPSLVTVLLLWIDKRFDFGGRYTNLFIIIASFNYILETVNASLNVFIYYNNSSNYKAAFDGMFGTGNRDKS